jgi:serine/threonine-protein kinase OSR1/STK39
MGGSALNIMKFSHPTGLDEASIATILKEAGAYTRSLCS